MSQSPEGFKKYSSEEMASIEKKRALSDAELLREGAAYKIGEKNEKTLELTEDQIKEIENTEDKEAVLEVVRKNGNALGFVSSEFRMDREVVLEAVKQNGMAILYADPDIGTSNKEMVLEAVRQNGDVLGHVSPEFRMDKEVVLEAVKQNPLAALYAPPGLQNDPDIIRAGERK